MKKKYRDMEKYRPDIGGVLERVDEIFTPWAPFSKTRWVGMVWPWMLIATFVGITFELAKYGILEVRRRIYNRNRNRKYAIESRNLAEVEGQNATSAGKGRKPKYSKKNQKWRTTPHGRGRGGYRGSCKDLLPLPSNFAEKLSRQWDRVRDSLEEALKFGELLIELEDYVDNSFIFGVDEIIGRMPGIKGFLEESCPHIVYKTAMRYRTLALKAREVSREQGKLHEISSKCDTICELSERLDETLKVEYRKAKGGKQRRRRGRRPASAKSPQSTIFSLREQAYSAFERLDGKQRERFATALQDLVRELLA